MEPTREVTESDFTLTQIEQKNTDIVISKPDITSIDVTVESDFVNAKANLESTLVTANDVMQSAANLAKMSDAPRAFEVVATLLQTIAGINNDIVTLHEKKRKAVIDSSAPTVGNTVNNAIFVGSNSELQQLLKDSMKNGV